jgi:hypothetical protein
MGFMVNDDKISIQRNSFKRWIFYTGSSNDLEVKDLKRIPDVDVTQFGKPIGAEVYELETRESKKLESGQLLSVWLRFVVISPEGSAVRV